MKRAACLMALLSTWGCGASQQTSPAASATEHARDEMRAGRIWDVANERAISRETLLQRMAQSRFVLLGERHDNAEHHRVQAELLRALGRQGRRPAVVFEMLEPSDEDALQALQPIAPADVDAIAETVAWQRSGWPAWPMYRPVFRAAAQFRLPIVAGNLETSTMKAVVKDGLGALDATLVERFGLRRPLPEPLRHDLRHHIEAGHCGMLPEAMVAPMMRAQRARDARLAQQMLKRATADGAVLIAGTEHVRADRGVPWYLREQSQAAIVSLGIVEVNPRVREPGAYARGAGEHRAFDYVWLTHGKEREDPCDALRERFSRRLVRR